MSVILFQKSTFIFAEDNGRERVLFNGRDPLKNKSSMALRREFDKQPKVVSELLFELANREADKADNVQLVMLLLDTLLAAQLIRFRDPIRMLEYGSGDGEISYHLAELVGNFNSDSPLTCVWNTFDLDWMEKMAGVQKMPKLSFFSGDFGHLEELHENWYDFIVLNGRANFEDPDAVIKDALRLLKDDGMIFAFVDDAPLLESAFKLHFETREEYEILPDLKILTANAKDKCFL